MLLFQVYIAFAAALIALAAGIALVVWLRIHKELTTVIYRALARFVMLLAFLVLVGVSYSATRMFGIGFAYSKHVMPVAEQRVQIFKKMRSDRALMLKLLQKLDAKSQVQPNAKNETKDASKVVDKTAENKVEVAA